MTTTTPSADPAPAPAAPLPAWTDSAHEPLDVAFYRSFYPDVGADWSNHQVSEHAELVGRAQQRMRSKRDFLRTMGRLLNLDEDLYWTVHLSANLQSTLAEVLPPDARAGRSAVQNLFGEDGTQALDQRFTRRLLNQADLFDFNCTWDRLCQRIDQHFGFDADFYRQVYTLPDTWTRDQVFADWMQQGVFEQKYPSAQWIARAQKQKQGAGGGGTSLLDALAALLQREFNVDLTFLQSSAGNQMARLQVVQKLVAPPVSGSSLTLFQFLNVGRALRVYFNQSDLDLDHRALLAQYRAAREAILAGRHPRALEDAAQRYAQRLAKQQPMQAQLSAAFHRFERSSRAPPLATTQAQVQAGALSLALTARGGQPLALPLTLDEAQAALVRAAQLAQKLRSVRYLRRVLSPAFWRLFRQANHIAPDTPLEEVALRITRHELAAAPNLNQLDVKKFLLEFVYHFFRKDRKDRRAYMHLVHVRATKLLTRLLLERGQAILEDVMQQDFSFLINNRALVKMHNPFRVLSALVRNATTSAGLPDAATTATSVTTTDASATV